MTTLTASKQPSNQQLKPLRQPKASANASYDKWLNI